MIDLVNVIEAVLASDALMSDLVFVPGRGATENEILNEERLVGRPFSLSHRRLLSRWNGIDLEVLRFYGCGQCEGVDRLYLRQNPRPSGEGVVVVGSGPDGFIYAESSLGFLSLDSRTGVSSRIAENLEDFVSRLVFGPDAAAFAGQEWAAELKSAGLW